MQPLRRWIKCFTSVGWGNEDALARMYSMIALNAILVGGWSTHHGKKSSHSITYYMKKAHYNPSLSRLLIINTYTLLGTNISPPKACLKMTLLFPSWNIMLVSWRIISTNRVYLQKIATSTWNLHAKFQQQTSSLNLPRFIDDEKPPTPHDHLFSLWNILYN